MERDHDSSTDISIKRFERSRAAFLATRFFIHLAPSAIYPGLRCNFVCDPRAVASCAITSISTSSILLSPASTLSRRLFFAFFLFFFPRFLPFLSAFNLFRRLSTFLLYFLFPPRRGFVSFVCTSHFRIPANSHEPSVVPIKSVGIVFKLIQAFAFYLYIRSSLPRRSLDRSGRFIAH